MKDHELQRKRIKIVYRQNETLDDILPSVCKGLEAAQVGHEVYVFPEGTPIDEMAAWWKQQRYESSTAYITDDTQTRAGCNTRKCIGSLDRFARESYISEITGFEPKRHCVLDHIDNLETTRAFLEYMLAQVIEEKQPNTFTVFDRKLSDHQPFYDEDAYARDRPFVSKRDREAGETLRGWLRELGYKIEERPFTLGDWVIADRHFISESKGLHGDGVKAVLKLPVYELPRCMLDQGLIPNPGAERMREAYHTEITRDVRDNVVGSLNDTLSVYRRVWEDVE